MISRWSKLSPEAAAELGRDGHADESAGDLQPRHQSPGPGNHLGGSAQLRAETVTTPTA